MWNPDRNVCINGYLIYHKSGTAENSGIMSPLNGSGQLNIHIFLFFFKGIPLFLFYLFIYLFLAVLGPRLCARAPPPSCGKRGPLFIAMRGPLTIAASPVAEHRLQTRRLSSCGSRA